MKYLNTKPGSIEEVAASMSKYAAESEYQQMFKKELEKAGKGIGSMTPAEKKAFFNKIDSKYTAKDETVTDKQLDTFHKKLDNLVHSTIGKSSDEKKEAVDNPYAVGMAAAMKAKNDTPPLKKSTITKAHDIAKSIEKDQKNEEKDVPPGHHKMPDGTIMKDSEHKKDKKETHSYVTNKMNQSQKDAKGEKDLVKNEADEKGDEINKMKLAKAKQGEKDIVDPKPKMSFKEAYKKVKKEAMNTVGDATADQANQLPGTGPKENDPDIKKPKAKADTGSKATPVDTSPEVEYKN